MDNARGINCGQMNLAGGGGEKVADVHHQGAGLQHVAFGLLFLGPQGHFVD